MNHQPHGTRDHARDRDHDHRQRSGGHDQHRVLDLDAEVFGEHPAAVLDATGVPAAGRRAGSWSSLSSPPCPVS